MYYPGRTYHMTRSRSRLRPRTSCKCTLSTFHSNTSTAGYHAVQGARGPLREGIEVRIADVNGTMVPSN